MGCGMVRKVDELGRVVIPKEMRRILNIKTGSSIEMSINDKNQVVLEKFSELTNAIFFAENLTNIIFDDLKLSCLLTDDEKVIICKGLSKNNLNKKLIGEINLKNKNHICFDNHEIFFENQEINFDFTYIFPISCEGFDNGFLFVFSNNEHLEENVIKDIQLLTRFLSNILKY